MLQSLVCELWDFCSWLKLGLKLGLVMMFDMLSLSLENIGRQKFLIAIIKYSFTDIWFLLALHLCNYLLSLYFCLHAFKTNNGSTVTPCCPTRWNWCISHTKLFVSLLLEKWSNAEQKLVIMICTWSVNYNWQLHADGKCKWCCSWRW